MHLLYRVGSRAHPNNAAHVSNLFHQAAITHLSALKFAEVWRI